MDIIIRPVAASELYQLVDISRQTFYETFAAVNTEENMRSYIDDALSPEKLAIELADSNAAFYFAMHSNEIAGYLKLNFGASQTELKDHNALEIERIYVTKHWLGKQVGQMLFQHAMNVARERDAHYVWLGVWEENHRAIRFYEKNGFVAFDKHIFTLGDDAQTDIMMKLTLK